MLKGEIYLGKYYEKEGVKMAIELYEELNMPEANTKDITKTIYTELDSAIKNCDLTDAQYAAIFYTYLKSNPTYDADDTGEVLGITGRGVVYAIDASVDKIHAYMNGEYA